MSATVPLHLRPMTFGLTELLLDVIYGIQRYSAVDLESVHILVCVQNATMHPFMTDPATPRHILEAARLPDELLGSVSRRAVADKTGLPRETVRRKAAELAAAGLIALDSADRLCVVQRLAEADLQQTVEGLHAAVLRYRQRIAGFGLDIAWSGHPAAGPGPVGRHVRPTTFAMTELVLDLVYGLQSYCQVDLEGVYILLCVTDATMRPFMTDPATPASTIAARLPTNDVRGWISRRGIADKTGLPRETVRRRTVELAEAGLLQIDTEDRVRSAQRMDDAAFTRVVEDGHLAVLRYFARLSSFGLAGL